MDTSHHIPAPKKSAVVYHMTEAAVKWGNVWSPAGESSNLPTDVGDSF